MPFQLASWLAGPTQIWLVPFCSLVHAWRRPGSEAIRAPLCSLSLSVWRLGLGTRTMQGNRVCCAESYNHAQGVRGHVHHCCSRVCAHTCACRPVQLCSHGACLPAALHFCACTLPGGMTAPRMSRGLSTSKRARRCCLTREIATTTGVPLGAATG